MASSTQDPSSQHPADEVPSGLTAEERHRNFTELFAPGVNVAIIGGRGSGKSWTASLVSSCALEHGYLVASNILCKRWLVAEDNPGTGTWVEEYPRGYTKVRSYHDLFGVIETALRRRRRVLFVLDEAGALAKSYAKGETSLTQAVRDSIAFMAIARHLDVCTLILSQSLENLGVSFRSFEGGLLDLVISKPRGSREIARFESDTGRVAERRVTAYGLAHPEEWAKDEPGRIVYSDSVAAFDRGVYPGTKVPFRLRELLEALSDQLPDRYPDIIREHLERPGAAEIETTTKAADAKTGERRETEKEEILRRHREGERAADIAKDMERRGHNRTYVYDVISGRR